MNDISPAGKFKTVVLPVTVLLLVCAIVLLLANHLAGDVIQKNARGYELEIVKRLMTLPYDNDLLNDTLLLEDARSVSGDRPLTVFRARQNRKIVGIVLKPVMARGYSGPIEMVMGLDADGSILGVDVISHRETEGLGDRIDRKNSDWLSIFNGISLSGNQPGEWATRSQGGQFDQISGATITSRGVINAIHETLEYQRLNHAKLYSE